jgi:hypothetical protein
MSSYQVRVSEHSYWDVVAEVIEPRVTDHALIEFLTLRAIQIQKARDLPLPAIVLIEKQD